MCIKSKDLTLPYLCRHANRCCYMSEVDGSGNVRCEPKAVLDFLCSMNQGLVVFLDVFRVCVQNVSSLDMLSTVCCMSWFICLIIQTSYVASDVCMQIIHVSELIMKNEQTSTEAVRASKGNNYHLAQATEAWFAQCQMRMLCHVLAACSGLLQALTVGMWKDIAKHGTGLERPASLCA